MGNECKHLKVLYELGMKNAIYNPEHNGSDEELFIIKKKKLVLQTARPSLCESLVALLVPHLGQHINVVTHAVADFRETETM